MSDSRRAFVSAAARAVAAGAITGLSPLLDACVPVIGSRRSRYQGVFDVSSLAADHDWLVTPTPGADRAPILIVRRAPDRFLALSMLCTHEGCPVRPPGNGGRGGLITCPCHGSQFDLEGKVRRGPARFALARYSTRYDRESHRLRVTSD